MIRMSAHHIETLAISLPENFPEFEYQFAGYGEEFKAYWKSFASLIINNPLLQIIIVRGMDDMCQNSEAPCLLKDKSCEIEDQPGYRDDNCEKGYGLVVGQIYTATEILSIIREFKNRTSYPGPQEELSGTFKIIAEALKRRRDGENRPQDS